MFPRSAGQIANANNDPARVKTGRVYGEMRGGREGEPSGDRRYTEEGSTNFAMKPGARRGDVGSAARFFNVFPIGDDEWVAELVTDPIMYCPKATKVDRAGSKHPTVKPIALMRWLCRLVTPPGGIVLDPFAGSGTTGQAANDEGFGCVLMEAEPQFAADIRRRFRITPPTPANDDDVMGFDLGEDIVG
jgi:site-specific DNA-methyltransferase (adenine-specific)